MENRFAAARRRYLRTHMDGIYTGMLLTGTLEPHLEEIGESAQAMLDRIVEQMKKAEGVTEQLKAVDQMEWVGRMNSIRSRAEEVVLSELVYYGGVVMFKYRRNRVLALCAGERRLLTMALLSFRNKLVASGKPTEDINELLIRLLR